MSPANCCFQQLAWSFQHPLVSHLNAARQSVTILDRQFRQAPVECAHREWLDEYPHRPAIDDDGASSPVEHGTPFHLQQQGGSRSKEDPMPSQR